MNSRLGGTCCLYFFYLLGKKNHYDAFLEISFLNKVVANECFC